MKSLLLALSLFTTKVLSSQRTIKNYNDVDAQIALDLDIVAYCGHQAYGTHVFTGVSEGFVHTKTLYNGEWDVEGFVGYLPSAN